ncbi:hypothetical protein FLM9_522 [Candidatus Synechococcus spongiarum]|uniref:Uncharacterized protein n=1 Tax=Candidatus Synechococcus spongiarum TaxID=431041 RepID=A0A171DFX7_9SYNE|nr:hypothetical protein FLM9_522 [Candidatus Synechococcus spongiarum]
MPAYHRHLPGGSLDPGAKGNLTEMVTVAPRPRWMKLLSLLQKITLLLS